MRLKIISEIDMTRRDLLKATTGLIGTPGSVVNTLIKSASDKYLPAVMAYNQFIDSGKSKSVLDSLMFELYNGHGLDFNNFNKTIKDALVGYQLTITNFDDPLSILTLLTGETPLATIPGYENFLSDVFNIAINKFSPQKMIAAIEKMTSFEEIDLFDAMANLTKLSSNFANFVKLNPAQLSKLGQSPNGGFVLQKKGLVSKKFAQDHARSTMHNREHIKKVRQTIQKKKEQEQKQEQEQEHKNKRQQEPRDREWHGAMHQWYEHIERLISLIK